MYIYIYIETVTGIFRAEADEIVARRINRQVQDEVRRDEVVRAIEDEVGFPDFLQHVKWTRMSRCLVE